MFHLMKLFYYGFFNHVVVVYSFVSINIRMKIFRMILLLGPPGAGKTTLLMALAGKLEHDLRVSFLLL